MTAKTDFYHNLAIKYFSGTIKPQEEITLRDYLLSSESHIAEFRAWEAEWLAQSEESPRAGWDALQTKLRGSRRKNPFLTWAPALAGAMCLVGALVLTFKEEKQTVSEYTLDVPLGSKSRLTLADGSVVWLNAGSQISYAGDFGTATRTLSLDGEAYFEVAKDEKLPFVVRTASYEVRVTGTRFNLSAYSEDDFCTTSLFDGAVDVIYSEQVIQMSPGKALRLDKQTGKIAFAPIETDSDKAWTEDRIAFDDIRLCELVDKLSRTYDRPIELAGQDLDDIRIKISLRNHESLEEVLSALKTILGVKIDYSDEHIIINR